MECVVRFFGGISRAAGVREDVRVRFDGNTLGDILARIEERWPGAEEYISGANRGAVIMVLNGEGLAGIDPGIELNDGDKLAVMPVIAGG